MAQSSVQATACAGPYLDPQPPITMPTSFQNLIARFFWPELGPPMFTVTSQDVYKLGRQNYSQVNITCRLQGQVPGDQCAWLVEFVSPMAFHPKRPLTLAFPWQRFFSESYLTSGSTTLKRVPAVIVIARSEEPGFWAALSKGREQGQYKPLEWRQEPGALPPAVGAPYSITL